MQKSLINEALTKVQSELKPIKKDAENPFFKSNYTSLSTVFESVLPLLTKNSLSVSQEGIFQDSRFLLKTTLRHTSGETIESVWPIFAKDDSPQALGSATSYARRYALKALIGVSDDDDDGEAAEGRGEQRQHGKAAGEVKKPTNYAPSSVSPADYVMPFGKTKGMTLKEIDEKSLKGAIEWAQSKGKFLEFAEIAMVYLQSREQKNLFEQQMSKDDQIPF